MAYSKTLDHSSSSIMKIESKSSNKKNVSNSGIIKIRLTVLLGAFLAMQLALFVLTFQAHHQNLRASTNNVLRSSNMLVVVSTTNDENGTTKGSTAESKVNVEEEEEDRVQHKITTNKNDYSGQLPMNDNDNKDYAEVGKEVGKMEEEAAKKKKEEEADKKKKEEEEKAESSSSHLLVTQKHFESDQYLQQYSEYFCTDVPCHKQLPDIFWSPIRLPTKEAKQLILQFKFAKRFIDECHNATPSHLLHTDLVVLPNTSTTKKQDCGWGTTNDDFVKIDGDATAVRTNNADRRGNKATSNHHQVVYDRVIPFMVPDAPKFQHFVDAVLPKIMMHYDFIVKHDVSIYVGKGQDPALKEMISRLGIKEVKDVPPPIAAKELYNGCVTPPLHPLLWRRARAILTSNNATGSASNKPNYNEDNNSNDERPIILVKRTKANAKNQGRLITNYEELRTSLKAKYGNRFVEYDSKDHTLQSTIDLWSNAYAVIASHGGALTNLIFCRPDTIVIESMPVKSNGDLYLKHGGMMFYVFSSLLGLNYWRLMALSTDNDVVIPPQQIYDILDDPTRPYNTDTDVIMSPLHKQCLYDNTC